MAWKMFLLFITLLLYKSSYCSKEQNCVQENPCLCRLNELQKIDLWPLEKSIDPLFKTTIANTVYFFRVCENEMNKIECGFNTKQNKTVYCEPPFSLCKCDTVNNSTITLGSIQDRTFVDTAKGPNTEKFVYSKGNNGTLASIVLACTQLDESFLYPLTNHSDEFLFFSKYACPVNEEEGISTGTTLLIIFFFFFVFYFIFGAFLLYFIRGARGIEMIPNLAFWKDLPYLVKDGFVFLLSGCKHTTQAYDRI